MPTLASTVNLGIVLTSSNDVTVIIGLLSVFTPASLVSANWTCT